MAKSKSTYRKNSDLSPEELLARRDAYYQKHYCISAEEYDVLLAKQGGVCKICGTAPKTRPLAVDHWHGWRYLKIVFAKIGECWLASCPAWENIGAGQGALRRDAITSIRRLLLRASIRGLLCSRCNPGLINFRDNPARLRAAADYVESFTSIIEVPQCEKRS
jgi:hypothetical protein